MRTSISGSGSPASTISMRSRVSIGESTPARTYAEAGQLDERLQRRGDAQSAHLDDGSVGCGDVALHSRPRTAVLIAEHGDVLLGEDRQRNAVHPTGAGVARERAGRVDQQRRLDP